MDENEINFKAYIIESINDLRTNPTKFIDEFQTIRYSLLNFKNDSVVEDISKVIDFLQTKNKEDKLILSNGLCKTAAKQIEVFQLSKESEFNQNTSSNKETAEVCAKRYLKDCGKIFQIQDQTTDSSKVVSKILITRTDKEKMNREIVFNPNHKYFGVAVAKVGRIYYFNILFSDKVQETEESTIDEAILEEINLIRSKDEVIINHYNLFEKKFLNEKLNFNSSLIDKFYTYLKSQEKFPALTRSIVLDEIAGILLKKSSEAENVNSHNHKDGVYVPEHEEFEGIVGRIISDYTQVDCLFIQGSADNQEDFINRVIFSGRQAHKGVDNLDILFKRKDLLNIGIAYEEVLNTKTKEKEGLVSIILVDQFKSAPKKSFIQIFKDEMTRLRKTPKTFIEEIEKFKERHSYKFKDDEVRFNTALEKLISYLKVCDGLPELTYNEDLHSAAYEYCYYINTPKNKKFFVEDEELLKIRLNHYIDGYKHFSELVYYGDFNATDVIVHLLLKETEKDFKKGEVNVLLGKTFKCFGVGQRVIRDKNLFVLILTDSTRKRGIVENNLKNDLISDINNLRLYPKSFMKFVKLPKNVEYNPFSDPEYFTTEEEKTLDFLSKTRSYGTLLEENELHKAAENYVFEKINTNETNVDVSLKLSNILNKLSSDRKVVLQTESEDYLKKHLEKFGSGFTHVYNIVDNNLDDFKTLLAKTGEDEPLNSKEYLVHILKVENNRKALLSVNYSYFGLYVHQERKLLNILLTFFA